MPKVVAFQSVQMDVVALPFRSWDGRPATIDWPQLSFRCPYCRQRHILPGWLTKGLRFVCPETEEEVVFYRKRDNRRYTPQRDPFWVLEAR